MKEVITLQIGQAGCQMGHSIWELLTAEHGLSVSGEINEPIKDRLGNQHLSVFFQESRCQKFVPRGLFIDMEPTVIDEIRTGSYRSLFHPNAMVNGLECSAGNFARGLFNSGAALIQQVKVQLRREFERTDGVQAFIIDRALGGGCGTGTTVAICDLLLDYAKVTRMELPIYPSPSLSTSTVEAYNAVLGEHYCMEDIDIGLLFDNEALYDICSKFIGVARPAYSHLNRMVAQIVSNVSASIRFDNMLTNDIATLQTNLIPYPRIHFPMCNFSPIISSERNDHEPLNVKKLIRSVFDQNNQMVKCDMRNGKFMACSVFMRGKITAPDIYSTLREIKRRDIAPFIDWDPTGFKAWSRLVHKYQRLFKKRAFLHWYIGEGLEEGEFKEAMENILTLVRDYDEIIADDKMGEGGGEGGEEEDEEQEVATGADEDDEEMPDQGGAERPEIEEDEEDVEENEEGDEEAEEGEEAGEDDDEDDE